MGLIKRRRAGRKAAKAEMRLQKANQDTKSRVDQGMSKIAQARDAAFDTLKKVQEAAASASSIVGDVASEAADSFASALETANAKFSQQVPAVAAYKAAIGAAVRDRKLTVNEIIDLLNHAGTGMAQIGDFAADEVAELHSRVTEVKTMVSAATELAAEVPRVAGRLADVNGVLVKAGLVPTGSIMEDLKVGAIHINGMRLDWRSLMLALAMIRTGKLVPVADPNASFQDVLWSDQTEIKQQYFDQTVISTTTYNPAKHTHARVRVTATGAIKLVPLTDVFPGLIPGAVIPAAIPAAHTNPDTQTATSSVDLELVLVTAVRMTHDTTSLLQVLGVAGLQSLRSSLAQIAPLGLNSISSFFNINGGTGVDFASTPSA